MIGTKCLTQKNRPKPIDSIDSCCLKHDDCCSKLSIAPDGKKPKCTCNKDMHNCYVKAKKNCETESCRVVANIL